MYGPCREKNDFFAVGLGEGCRGNGKRGWENHKRGNSGCVEACQTGTAEKTVPGNAVFLKQKGRGERDPHQGRPSRNSSMRVVFDSNIFISALIFPGSQADKAIQRILEGNDLLILSSVIIHQVLDVLSKKFSRDREELSKVAVNLADLALMVRPAIRLNILQDEPDNRILECAVAGNADVIVTGDKAMLDLRIFEGVRIISLRDYLS